MLMCSVCVNIYHMYMYIGRSDFDDSVHSISFSKGDTFPLYRCTIYQTMSDEELEEDKDFTVEIFYSYPNDVIVTIK